MTNKFVLVIVLAVLFVPVSFAAESTPETLMHRANWKVQMESALQYVKNGDLTAAQNILGRARKEAEATGANNPALPQTEKMAGDVYAAQNNLNAAERAYRRSIYLFERAESPDRGEFAAALSSYAELLKRQNRMREASRFEMRASLIRATNDDSTAQTNQSL